MLLPKLAKSVCGHLPRHAKLVNQVGSLEPWRHELGIKEAKERIDKLARERKERLGKNAPPSPAKPINPIEDEQPTTPQHPTK
jgi:hypothetical protein